MRFALLEAKLALAHIVKNFQLFPSPKTVEPIKMDPMNAIAYPKDGLYVKVEKIH